MTNALPIFFVPSTKPKQQEEKYAELATLCKCRIPPADERIYSITFARNNDLWTATVGRRLRGLRVREMRTRGAVLERHTRLLDPAVVTAIFPGVSYMVAIEGASEWQNPLLAGEPRSIIYFASDVRDESS